MINHTDHDRNRRPTKRDAALRERLRREKTRHRSMRMSGREPTTKAILKLQDLVHRVDALRPEPLPPPAASRDPQVFEASIRALPAERQRCVRHPKSADEGLSPLRRIQALIANHHERALKRGLVSTLTEAQWGRIVDAQEGKCVYCDTTARFLTIEHLIPISKGGPNAVENVIGICATCNTSKSAKDLIDWLDSKGIRDDIVFSRISKVRDMAGAA